MGIKVMITGASGMVGEGVLLTCLNDADVSAVLMVNRRHVDIQHPKLKECIVPDFTQPQAMQQQLSGYDACFFCAGVTSIGKKEADYTYLTYDTTMRFAEQIATWNPGMVFTYVSGSSTDSTEQGKVMWARVKGKTENDLMKLPFKKAYAFRPGGMTPVPGQKNLKPVYKILVPLFSLFAKRWMLKLEEVGRAMINVVTKGYRKQVLEIKDIREAAKG